MKLTQEHEALAAPPGQFVEKELNPHIDAWEEEGIFPAHEVFKKMGDLGLLGICKPEENGGMGLDYSYNMVVAEELGRIACGGVPMAIGVQTDMATPALARFGSNELRDEFLTPGHCRRVCRLDRRLRTACRLRRCRDQDHRPQRRR
jgi:citronellyl-CoA dehydrogenase